MSLADLHACIVALETEAYRAEGRFAMNLAETQARIAALEARITALRAAGDALARHVAEDNRGQTARQLVQAWEEAAR